MKPNFIKVLSR